MFDLVKKQDILVTYPYQSFDHLIRFLREAAIDPKVEAIKMTLYRAARNSQVVNALVNAARNGKRIHVNIELTARFDEENNIRISERLKEVEAQVTYGVPPMKVHAKLSTSSARAATSPACPRAISTSPPAISMWTASCSRTTNASSPRWIRSSATSITRAACSRWRSHLQAPARVAIQFAQAVHEAHRAREGQGRRWLHLHED
jgi:hypothetical protein